MAPEDSFDKSDERCLAGVDVTLDEPVLVVLDANPPVEGRPAVEVVGAGEEPTDCLAPVASLGREAGVAELLAPTPTGDCVDEVRAVRVVNCFVGDDLVGD